MSNNSEQLHEAMETHALDRLYEQRLCMWKVSKNLDGNFYVDKQEHQKCARPGCVTLKARIKFESAVTRHIPCDDPPAVALDGDINGELVFAYIEHGNERGFHNGTIEWLGGTSRLVGHMSGVTNAGTHRDCEDCNRGGHMEGRLYARVVDGEHRGCSILASYVINFDASDRAQDTGISGALEGVLICSCRG